MNKTRINSVKCAKQDIHKLFWHSFNNIEFATTVL